MAAVDETLRHLLSLRPNDGLRNPEKCLTLARSFLRSETLWMTALGIPADTYPCVDLAAQLGQGDLPPHIERIFRESRFAQSTAEALACRNYLRWTCLQMEKPETILSFGLDDPFDPLIDLFKEGAEFSVEGWMFDILKCGGINVRALRARTLEG